MSNPNTDPHTFEASPQRRPGGRRRRLVVQNGVGYDTLHGQDRVGVARAARAR